MRQLVYAAGWVVVLAGGAARGEDADAKAILAKAIKAHGGADVLNKFPAMSLKDKGKFYGMGEGIDFTAEVQFQAPDQERLEIQADNFKFVQVVHGDKGWIAINGETKDMDKDQLAEAREEVYAANVGRLAPLTGADYKLSSLGEVKVEDRPAVGVRVEHKGHRDIGLFFDKESGLLVKMERRGKDLMAGGREYAQETIYRDFKKVEGRQVPCKIIVRREGKRYLEMETTEASPAEKLDASVFGKP
jgi:hypothetical protein